jgi:antitoxin VapB
MSPRTTRVFKSGNSQAVRLPREFQFDVSEVEIFRRGDEVVLRKKPGNLGDLFDALVALGQDDFMTTRQQPAQERDFSAWDRDEG